MPQLSTAGQISTNIAFNIELLQLNSHIFLKDWLNQRTQTPLITHKIKDATATKCTGFCALPFFARDT